MAFNAIARAVNADGTLTQEFLAYLTALENGIPVITEADLARIKPGPGWQRFVTDLGIVATGDGTQWLDPTGTPIP